ncbi:hypothetical protein [Anaerosporobacter faecicola]|nr:hypothetical protein [Anaerosporobacter faecicola]
MIQLKEVTPDNWRLGLQVIQKSKQLYQKVGFKLTGERDGDEIIMQLNL